MEKQTRIYTVELTDAQYGAIAQLAENKRVQQRALAAELALGSAGAQAIGANVAELAEGFGALGRMRGDDDGLTLGTNMLRRWYNGRVRDLAEDILGRILSGDVSDLQDELHETVDGTDIVIYTYKASAALLASDNEDAWEDFGLEAPTTEQRAYCALEADVREELQRLASDPPDGTVLPDGFDLDYPSTWTAEPDEDEADEPTDLEGRLDKALGLADGTSEVSS